MNTFMKGIVVFLVAMTDAALIYIAWEHKPSVGFTSVFAVAGVVLAGLICWGRMDRKIFAAWIFSTAGLWIVAAFLATIEHMPSTEADRFLGIVFLCLFVVASINHLEDVYQKPSQNQLT